MVKHIPQEYYLSGNNEYLTVSDTFIYEVSVYRVFKDRAELANSEFLSSKKPLNIKNNSVWNKTPEYHILKCIDWRSAPENYLINKQFKKVLK